MEKLTDKEAIKLITRLEKLASKGDTPEFQNFWNKLNNTNARIEFPLGEITNPKIGGYIWAWKLKNNIRVIPITSKDRYNAQGLEGKAYVETNLVAALLAYRELPCHRRQLFIDKGDKKYLGDFQKEIEPI